MYIKEYGEDANTGQDTQNTLVVVNNPGVFGTIISVPITNQPHAGVKYGHYYPRAPSRMAQSTCSSGRKLREFKEVDAQSGASYRL
jgi:hypothetical protein